MQKNPVTEPELANAGFPAFTHHGDFDEAYAAAAIKVDQDLRDASAFLAAAGAGMPRWRFWGWLETLTHDHVLRTLTQAMLKAVFVLRKCRGNPAAYADMRKVANLSRVRRVAGAA